MKAAGLIILIVGLFMTLYAGFAYVTRESAADGGELGIAGDDVLTLNWQPYVGIGTMVVGGVVLILGRKKPKST